MNLIRGTIGSPARGEEFWDREQELAAIWRALETSSVLLTAPRRFGKTSLMLRLVDFPREGWQAFYFDPEWINRPEDFIADIALALLREKKLRHVTHRVKKFLSEFFGRIEEIGAAEFRVSLREQLALRWQDVGRELIGMLKGLDLRTVLIVDELPLLVDKIAKERDAQSACAFLAWLRSLRQMPDLHDKIRWVMGGSIGIEKVLRSVGAGTKEIGDLERIHVREFTEVSARAFIKGLLQSVRAERVPKRILDKYLEVVGIPIPYFLQILVRESLNEMERQGRRTLTEEIIEHAYEEGVLASYNRTYFEHYYERLKDYYDPKIARIGKTLLTEIARRGSLTKKELWIQFQILTQEQGDEDIFSSLLSDLENDFYLVCTRGQKDFHFTTKVLRDWWLRYHAI
jgi:hypothetical protein